MQNGKKKSSSQQKARKSHIIKPLKVYHIIKPKGRDAMIEIKVTAETAQEITKEIQDLAKQVTGASFHDVQNGKLTEVKPVEEKVKTAEAKPSATVNAVDKEKPAVNAVIKSDPKPAISAVVKEEPASAGLPVAPERKYTKEEIMTACGPLMDQGKQAELASLVQSFGAQSISYLGEEHYPALVVKLREMGAQI